MDVKPFAGLPWQITCKIELADSRQEFGESDPGFQARQGCAKAKMDPVPEGQVRVGIARDVEAVRVGELFWITICRSEHHQGHFPGGDGLTVHLNVAPRHAKHPLQGRAIAQDFFDSGGQQLRSSAQASELIRTFDEAEDGIVD